MILLQSLNFSDDSHLIHQVMDDCTCFLPKNLHVFFLGTSHIPGDDCAVFAAFPTVSISPAGSSYSWPLGTRAHAIHYEQEWEQIALKQRSHGRRIRGDYDAGGARTARGDRLERDPPPAGRDGYESDRGRAENLHPPSTCTKTRISPYPGAIPVNPRRVHFGRNRSGPIVKAYGKRALSGRAGGYGRTRCI